MELELYYQVFWFAALVCFCLSALDYVQGYSTANLLDLPYL